MSALAVSGATVYWADESTGKGIWKYTKGDASPQLLVPRFTRPSIIAVRGNYFYWISTSEWVSKKFLYKTSLDGSTTVLLGEGTPSLFDPVLVDDTDIYWRTAGSSRTSSSAAAIQKIPMDGSAPQVIYDSTRDVYGFAADGAYLYWLEADATSGSSQMNLCRINKGGGTRYVLSRNINNPLESSPLSYSSNSVYVATYGGIVKISTTDGSAIVVAQGNVEPYGMVTSGGALYWMNYDRSSSGKYGSGQYSLLSVPLNGGTISVVAANVTNLGVLRASDDGLYWTESDPASVANGAYRVVLKRYRWGSASPTVVASSIFCTSFEILNDYVYYANFDYASQYAEIAKRPSAGGAATTILGGVNSSRQVLTVTAADLLIGDGTSLKKVPINGGVTKTLVMNGRLDIVDIKESNGTVYFTSGGTDHGLHKISMDGTSYAVLANEDGLYGKILSMQDGYVYYLLAQATSSQPRQELRRVPVGGGNSERVYQLPANVYFAGFEGLDTVYWQEWIWNDQYKLIKHDIPSGTSKEIWSGSVSFLGSNSTYVLLNDYRGNIFAISKTDGSYKSVISIPYPLYLGTQWIKSGENFYFVTNYLDTQGYFSEIDLLENL